ncbi:DUF4878 domain-containing protein [Polaribacter sp. Hel1_85]|uniref:DUF4878 domain-containing protein n=1 Tax=Polaribacter sp. Hel1_85 TaxID=1250005 RepID=UPI00052C2DB3|nr:DUF4878 domain-containing protein [Polaribacter sp. Hel1_85]KGL63797.1 hypothetical protein PHEL85_0838 [Polaribacter sp. Hel1_85]
MIKNYILILLTILILTSCGKSKEELELEKAKIELEKTKLELAEKIKGEENLKTLKIHEQKSNVGKRKKLTELTLQLQNLTTSKNKIQQNIENIKKFQIGRAQSTKDKQLREARNKLSEIFDYERKIKNEIAQSEYLKTFEFQKNPESVMKYIFESSKKGDFSNFRNLCDPYGENDRDVNQICYAEMLSKKHKEELENMFKNGRIIGETIIKEDRAEIEFAFGLSSNKLEKMGMVKRNNLWYLSEF